MSLQAIYLTAFLAGFLLSAISFLAGALHLPHLHFHGYGGKGFGHAHPYAEGRSSLPWFNIGTLAAFLAWFGATGYLLQRYTSIWTWLVWALSGVSGVAGAALIFWFMAKLARSERAMDPADYDMIGVLGKVASPIRPGGTGEMIYARDGSRRAAAIRSEDGSEISRGSEVVVTRYEKGVAYVRLWEDLSGERY